MAVVVIAIEDGERRELRAWRKNSRVSASRLGATHRWEGDPNRPGSRVVPIDGPNFAPSPAATGLRGVTAAPMAQRRSFRGSVGAIPGFDGFAGDGCDSESARVAWRRGR